MSKRNPLTGNVEPEEKAEAETPFETGASLNGGQAPEGSAERVRDMHPDALYPDDGADVARDEEVMVQTYDANGEAIEVPAQHNEPQPGLPGMPPAPDIWPRYLGRRVASMSFAFGGKVQADAHDEWIHNIASNLNFGLPVVATVHGQIADIDHKGKDTGPLEAVAKVKVAWIDWSAGAQESPEAQRNQDALDVIDEMLDDLDGETELFKPDYTIRALRRVMARLNGDEPEPETSKNDTAAPGDPEEGDAEHEDAEEREETGMLDEALAEAGVP